MPTFIFSIVCIVALIVANQDYVIAQTTVQRLEEAPDKLQQGESATKTKSVPNDSTLEKDRARDAVSPVVEPNEPKAIPTKMGPDERILWRYYHQRKISKVKTTIKGWRKRYPGWYPPEDLSRLIKRHNLQRSLNRALATHDLVKLDGLRKTNPHLFDCTKIDNSWNLARIQAANGNTQSALQTYSTIIDRCGDKQLSATTLQKAKTDLPGEAYMKLLNRAEGKIGSIVLSNLRYSTLKDRLINALDQSDDVAVDQITALLTPVLTARQDASLASHLAWHRYNQKKLQSSLAWFNKASQWNPANEDVAYGLALTNFDLNKIDDVKRIADRFPNSKRLQYLKGNILIADAWQALKQGDLETSRKLSAQARISLGSTRGLRELNAWLNYHEGEYRPAAEAFEKLYRSKAEPSIGRGMVLSYSKLKDRSALVRLRGYSDYLLLKELDKLDAQKHYYNRHFLSAYQLDPDFSDTLRNVDSASIEAGIIFRHRPGNDSMDRLDVQLQPIAAASYNHNIHQFTFQASRLRLTNGRPSDCVAVGSLAIRVDCASQGSLTNQGNQINIDTSATYSQSPTTVVKATAYDLSYSMDGWTSPYFSVGLTPDGPVGRAISFRGGLKQQISWGNLRLEGFSQPVKESILSYTGMNDPYSNRQFGRVLKSGVAIDLQYKLDKNWRLSGQLMAAVLNGKRVADNWMISGTTGLSYLFDIPEFDYLTVGPTLTAQHYDKNLNHYTLGHGGYFSPKLYVNAGLGLNFLTNEGQKYIAKGILIGGYQYFDESKTPWFPTSALAGFNQNTNAVIQKDGDVLFNGTPFYDGNQDAGISFSTEVKAAWLIFPHIQFGGGFFARKTADYEDYGAGVFIRMFFFPRNALFSTDIPDYLFRSVQ